MKVSVSHQDPGSAHSKLYGFGILTGKAPGRHKFLFYRKEHEEGTKHTELNKKQPAASPPRSGRRGKLFKPEIPIAI